MISELFNIVYEKFGLTDKEFQSMLKYKKKQLNDESWNRSKGDMVIQELSQANDS